MAGLGDVAELRDMPAPDHVALREQRIEFAGPIFTIRNDQIEFESGDLAWRQYMDHHDAVAVVAMRSGAESASGEPEVLLIRQYRHASRRIFWEIPAGLRDISGEDGLLTAQRELAEEADMQAADWRYLVSFYASPGCSNENLDIYLATGVTPVTESSLGADFEREDEEREIVTAWWPLSQVRAAVRRGDLRSPTLVLGVLAAYDELNK